jgi:SAM-dependent methyltransferase
VTSTRYDRIGRSYAQTRRTDPRIEAQVDAALGDAATVVNVGAGTGSYEPTDRKVVAVEPSPTMIGQRPAGRAPVVRAYAESLPFRDVTFDAALAIFTVHHWHDKRTGLLELARVARRQVILSYDHIVEQDFWLIDDYFPEIVSLDDNREYTTQAISRVLDVQQIEPVLVPTDCLDGFMACYWSRPERYTDPVVQAGISGFARLDPALRERGTARLRTDLASGAWDERHGHLRALAEFDAGYRLLVARS